MLSFLSFYRLLTRNLETTRGTWIASCFNSLATYLLLGYVPQTKFSSLSGKLEEAIKTFFDLTAKNTWRNLKWTRDSDPIRNHHFN